MCAFQDTASLKLDQQNGTLTMHIYALYRYCYYNFSEVIIYAAYYNHFLFINVPEQSTHRNFVLEFPLRSDHRQQSSFSYEIC